LGVLHELAEAVSPAMWSWYQAKLFIEHSLSISHDTLHMLVGVLLWLALGLLLRRSLLSWWPWLWLALAIVWNEAVDLWVERWPNPGQQYGEGAKDLILTLAVPSLIMLAARLRPDLFRQSPGRRQR